MAFSDVRNKYQAIGRLGGPLKEVGNDRYVFSIAVSDGAGKDRKPFWPSFFVSGQAAEFMNKYCNKGDLLIVEARYVEWEGKDGSRKNSFDAVSVSKLGGGREEGQEQSRNSGNSGNSGRSQSTNRPNNSSSRDDDGDYDIPF